MDAAAILGPDAAAPGFADGSEEFRGE